MSSKDEEPKFQTYIGDLLDFMGYCKIWKSDKLSRIKNFIVTMLVGSLLSSDVAVIIMTLIDFKNATNDLTTFASYVGPLCLQCIGLFKWTYCIMKTRDIAKLIKTLEKCHELSMRINDNDSGWKKYRNEMISTRSHYLRFIYGWLWLCVYGILHWCSNPLILELKDNGFARETLENHGNFTRMRNLPYFGWRPWSVDDNIGYVLMFIVQFIGGLGSAIGSVTYDVFYIASLMIVCSHLRYLNNSLVDVIRTKNKTSAVTDNFDFEIKLKHCVKHHTEILTFLEALEILASPAMFVQCVENIIVLCLVSLEASSVEVNTNLMTIIKLWSMLEYFLSVIVQLFVYCYYATEIRTLGLQIADSVYLCSWEQFSCNYGERNGKEERSIRNINIIIQIFILRSQKAILLTGGPFYVLSLETFKAVVGLAMSNSVILRQVAQDQA